MARPVTELEQLGAYVASALDKSSVQRAYAVEAARRGFLEHELRGRSPRASLLPRRAMFAWSAAAGVAALILALIVVLTRHRTPLAFEVEGSPGVARTWLAAPETGGLSLAFSEGTRMRLEAAARARVADIDEHGATVTLESGRLHAEVVHRADSVWKVVAGPFTVRVTGTVFDVDWDATARQLAVTVERGSVAVKDPSTGVEQVVRASQTLNISAAEGEHRLAIASSPSPVSSVPPGGQVPFADALDGSPGDSTSGEPHDGAPAMSTKDAELSTEKATAGTEEWRTFAKRGALREAFASAEAAGFSRTCANASPAELLMLGDGARLSSNSSRAEEALLTLRRRYPHDARRAAAAFALGKVAFDQRGAYEQAAAWFATSLREQPGGPLARDASGRLIEALRRAHDAAGARRAAHDYLEKYPEGPHADLARSVLR